MRLKNMIQISMVLSLVILAMLVPGCIGNGGSNTPSQTISPSSVASPVVDTGTPVPLATTTGSHSGSISTVRQSSYAGRTYATPVITNGSDKKNGGNMQGELGNQYNP